MLRRMPSLRGDHPEGYAGVGVVWRAQGQGQGTLVQVLYTLEDKRVFCICVLHGTRCSVMLRIGA